MRRPPRFPSAWRIANFAAEPALTRIDTPKMASLFQEFRLKDVVLRNRIAVSPMCQYSSDNGFPNDWHLVHLGSRAVGGAGLVMVEATAVSPEGRISPADSGIYLDDHVEPFARISRFLKQYGAVPGIQLAHAGRKASVTQAVGRQQTHRTDKGGWDIIAPSAVPFGGNLTKVPREMSVQDIARIQEAFVAAAKRALAAGFEWLELHYAHGYLAHEFYSPLANKRTDSYGGSFENRIRFLLETFAAVRKVWPERFPLTVRLSVTDWIEGGVTVDESVELVRRLKAAGLDLLDVSHGSDHAGHLEGSVGAGVHDSGSEPHPSRIRNPNRRGLADYRTATGRRCRFEISTPIW